MKKIVICTSPRTTNYIHQIFHTIKENTDIHLFVCGEDTRYLQKYISYPNVSVTTTPMNSNNVAFRMVSNHKRCLSEGYVEGDDGIFIVEDDVKFAQGWKLRLEEIIADLKAKHNDNFVLTAFTARTLCRSDNLPPLHYLPISNLNDFLGSQGIYYPNAARKKILKCLNKIDESNKLAYDIHLRNIFGAENIPIYAAIPCLVEHVGYTSSWRSNRFMPAATIFHQVLA